MTPDDMDFLGALIRQRSGIVVGRDKAYLLENRLTPIDDPTLGPRRATIEEVRRNIAAAGFRPADPGEAA